MKGLRNFLDRQEKHFVKGGKLEKFYPLYEAIDSFLYTPGEITQKDSHARDVMDLKRVMMIVVYSLIPAVLMALYNTGLQANLALEQMGAASTHGWRSSILLALGFDRCMHNSRGTVLFSDLYSYSRCRRALGSVVCLCEKA
jgi:Na+-transporting NADH:ubiquinone oxidoreductase subunit B